MIQQQLREQLDAVAHRFFRLQLHQKLSFCWLLFSAIGLGLWWLVPQMNWLMNWAGPSLLAISALTGFLILGFQRHKRRTGHPLIAHEIERSYPDLNSRLLAALEQQPDWETGRFSYLQQQVINEALQHGKQHNWQKSIPQTRLTGFACLHLITLSLLAIVTTVLFVSVSQANHSRLTSSQPERVPTVNAPSQKVTVDPGDVSIERGTSLLVLARFSGNLPADVSLYLEPSQGETQNIALSQSLDDPVFGGRIDQVDHDATYSIQYDGQQTEPYRVTVYEHPQLLQADALITFPEYTNRAEEKIEDVRQISAVEGSEIRLLCQVNKPLAQARLVPEKDAASLDLAASAEDPHRYEVTLSPKKTTRYKLELIDPEGRPNKHAPEFVFHVIPNRKPELKAVFPARDRQVSPLEELTLEATAWDDFGLEKYGLIYTIAGNSKKNVVLGKKAPGQENQVMTHLLSLENLNADPDQLLSYYFFAEDIGPKGEVRRTFSDMYFAEVRSFEEIFRQGQQPSGGSQQQQGGSPNAQKAEKLARLQKEILNATWKLFRRETALQPSKKFVEDVEVIEQSQKSVVEQAQKLGEKLRTPQSQAILKTVLKHMTQAQDQLNTAAEDNTADPLSQALTAERSAYQSLLKLRAREHQVIRGQQGGGGKSGGSNRSQQQLQQLELTNKKNRYESQRSSQNNTNSSADREQLQVLNRLRELARRQSDMNEKLKELENALRAAQTEEEKEEIRRRLKRLREEQQELLRNVDELRNRMDRPENQSRMTKSRQKLEQTRQRVRRTSEALQEGQVSKALSSGTRAQRELQQLRNEFRRKTAGEFDQAMRDLRQQARELTQRQQQLGNKLNKDKPEKPQPQSLRDVQNRGELPKDFQQQKQRVDDLLQQMRRLVQQSEHSEPLLSNQLYETIRKAREDKPSAALDMTSELLKRGLQEEAQRSEKVARKGVESLQEGVEKAADSVLGNEVESLKRAKQELENLAEALENEVDQADPKQQQNRGAAQSNPNESGQSSRSSAKGEQQNQSENQTGRSDKGEPQQGQPQNKQQRSSQNSNQNQTGNSNQSSQSNSQQKPTGDSRSSQKRSSQSSSKDGHGKASSPKKTSQSQQQQKSSSSNSQSKSPSKSQSSSSQSSGKQSSQQQSSSQSQQSGQSSSQSSSDSQSNSSSSQSNQPSSQSNSQNAGSQQSRPGLRKGRNQQSGSRQPSSLSTFLNQGGRSGGPGGPLTGENFQQWSDRMRDVEEMVQDPKLRSQVSQIRDRARSARAEFKRHSKEPNWPVVRKSILNPLVELQNRLQEEIARKKSKKALVPLDRDPVPERYSELVRRYYERLGKGK